MCPKFKLGRRCRGAGRVERFFCLAFSFFLLLTAQMNAHSLFHWGSWKLFCHMLRFYLEPSAMEKRDRIYYLLHSIIVGPGVLPRWKRSQKSLLGGGYNSLGQTWRFKADIPFHVVCYWLKFLDVLSKIRPTKHNGHSWLRNCLKGL